MMGKRILRSSVGTKSPNVVGTAQEKKKQETAEDTTSAAMKTYRKKTKQDDKVKYFFN